MNNRILRLTSVAILATVSGAGSVFGQQVCGPYTGATMPNPAWICEVNRTNSLREDAGNWTGFTSRLDAFVASAEAGVDKISARRAGNGFGPNKIICREKPSLCKDLLGTSGPFRAGNDLGRLCLTNPRFCPSGQMLFGADFSSEVDEARAIAKDVIERRGLGNDLTALIDAVIANPGFGPVFPNAAYPIARAGVAHALREESLDLQTRYIRLMNHHECADELNQRFDDLVVLPMAPVNQMTNDISEVLRHLRVVGLPTAPFGVVLNTDVSQNIDLFQAWLSRVESARDVASRVVTGSDQISQAFDLSDQCIVQRGAEIAPFSGRHFDLVWRSTDLRGFRIHAAQHQATYDFLIAAINDGITILQQRIGNLPSGNGVSNYSPPCTSRGSGMPSITDMLNAQGQLWPALQMQSGLNRGRATQITYAVVSCAVRQAYEETILMNINIFVNPRSHAQGDTLEIEVGQSSQGTPPLKTLVSAKERDYRNAANALMRRAEAIDQLIP